jgi:small subunit ribosomal protein S8
MSPDIIADCLNQMMNAKKAGHDKVRVKKHSKFLANILAIGKLRGYVKDYKVEGTEMSINFDKLNFCKAVKPRYVVRTETIDKYVRRYLPGRGLGILIISTSQGLMAHQTAIERKIGGSVIAYFY